MPRPVSASRIAGRSLRRPAPDLGIAAATARASASRPAQPMRRARAPSACASVFICRYSTPGTPASIMRLRRGTRRHTAAAAGMPGTCGWVAGGRECPRRRRREAVRARARVSPVWPVPSLPSVHLLLLACCPCLRSVFRLQANGVPIFLCSFGVRMPAYVGCARHGGASIALPTSAAQLCHQLGRPGSFAVLRRIQVVGRVMRVARAAAQPRPATPGAPTTGTFARGPGGHMLHRTSSAGISSFPGRQPRATASQRQQLRLRAGLSSLLQPWAEHIGQA